MELIQPTSQAVAARPLGFGKCIAKYMSVCHFQVGQGWDTPEIVPYKAFELDPCALVLHYGQSIYEGLKAYARVDSSIGLFRPERNAARFRASAARMAMAEMPESLFLRAVHDLVSHQRYLLPAPGNGSLYLRPVMIADEAAFGVRRSASYLFFIVATPVDDLYQPGGRGMRLRVTEDFARIASKGGGDAKTSGNYARTILALDSARADGFDNVLWLDPTCLDHIEEAGITNVFVQMNTGEIFTPPLNGRILAGVTRQTVIEQARDWGLVVNEEEISIAKLTEALRVGDVREIFLTGTATHIAPIDSISWRGNDYRLPAGSSQASTAGRLASYIRNVQSGVLADPNGWMSIIK